MPGEVTKNIYLLSEPLTDSYEVAYGGEEGRDHIGNLDGGTVRAIFGRDPCSAGETVKVTLSVEPVEAAWVRGETLPVRQVGSDATKASIRPERWCPIRDDGRVIAFVTCEEHCRRLAGCEPCDQGHPPDTCPVTTIRIDL